MEEDRQLRCLVCRAPTLSGWGSCPFCQTPLSPLPPLREGIKGGSNEGCDPFQLLEYLAPRLPEVEINYDLISRRVIKGLRAKVGDKEYGLRWRRKRYECWPNLELSLWIDQLLQSLTAVARQDYQMRKLLSRNGWAWR